MYMFFHSGHIVYIFTSFNIYKKIWSALLRLLEINSLGLAYNVFL